MLFRSHKLEEHSHNSNDLTPPIAHRLRRPLRTSVHPNPIKRDPDAPVRRGFDLLRYLRVAVVEDGLGAEGFEGGVVRGGGGCVDFETCELRGGGVSACVLSCLHVGGELTLAIWIA